MFFEAVLNKKRYDHFPFYFSPFTDEIGTWQDKFLEFGDYLIDAHEDEPAIQETEATPYKRMIFTLKHFYLYQNPTMGNLLYETQAKNYQYQKVEAAV